MAKDTSEVIISAEVIMKTEKTRPFNQTYQRKNILLVINVNIVLKFDWKYSIKINFLKISLKNIKLKKKMPNILNISL